MNKIVTAGLSGAIIHGYKPPKLEAATMDQIPNPANTRLREYISRSMQTRKLTKQLNQSKDYGEAVGILKQYVSENVVGELFHLDLMLIFNSSSPLGYEANLHDGITTTLVKQHIEHTPEKTFGAIHDELKRAVIFTGDNGKPRLYVKKR